MIPNEALNYFEYETMPFKVFALVDENGVVWWRTDDGKGKWTDMFECSVGDRTLHINELIEGK